VDCAFNTIWEVPVIGYLIDSKKGKSDITNFIGNTLFDLGGILAPVPSTAKDGYTKGFAVAAISLSTLGYGICMFTTTFL